MTPQPLENIPSPDEFAALEGMAQALTASGHYRVIRKFRPRDVYERHNGTEHKRALFLDIETTGLDHRSDAIIEIALVPFEYAPADGRIFGVGAPVCCLEDPGRPIPAKVTAMTGISDDMVRGQRIAEDAIGQMLPTVSLVIAHNAGFDRKFVERRLPGFCETHWACSMREVPWRDHGCGSNSLEFILFRSCAEFFDGHRALQDCHAGIHALATPTACGDRPMRLLLESARRVTTRVWATGAPYDARAALKARDYRWFPGDERRTRAWYRDVLPSDADAECDWLCTEIFGRRVNVERTRMSARERYSGRI